MINNKFTKFSIILLGVVAGMYVMMYFLQNNEGMEGEETEVSTETVTQVVQMQDENGQVVDVEVQVPVAQNGEQVQEQTQEQQEAKPVEEQQMVEPSGGDSGAPVPVGFSTCGPSLDPKDLLPSSEAAKAFEQQFPIGVGDISEKNFLTAGFNIGINTVSSSLKNANRQLRSDPYVPRVEVGPWSNSTILPSDLNNRKQFEIGSNC